MEQAISERNDATRAELQALMERLTPADWDRSLGGGWTVKAALMHLAFWDRFAVALVDQWSRTAFERPQHDDDPINIAALPAWLIVPAAAAVHEVNAAARAADHRAASVSEPLKRQITESGETWVLDRSDHRAEHLAQLVAILGATA